MIVILGPTSKNTRPYLYVNKTHKPWYEKKLVLLFVKYKGSANQFAYLCSLMSTFIIDKDIFFSQILGYIPHKPCRAFKLTNMCITTNIEETL